METLLKRIAHRTCTEQMLTNKRQCQLTRSRLPKRTMVLVVDDELPPLVVNHHLALDADNHRVPVILREW